MSDLLNELRNNAIKVCNNKSKLATSSIVEILIAESRQASHEGKFFLHIWLKDKGWSLEEAMAAAIELRKDDFDVSVGNEITAMYSNTDYDTEKFIKVSWK